MPELPEVETVRRQLEPMLVGRVLEAGWGDPRPRFADAFDAHGVVTAVRRRGKYLLLELDSEQEVVIHLGMTGTLHFRPISLSGTPTATSKADRHVRAAWTVGDQRLVLRDPRGFGRVALVPRGDYRGLPTLLALGPEPLDPEFSALQLWEGLRRSRAHTKSNLLSQRIVAGIGNIYADEALWHARIHPAAREVTKPGAARLHAALVTVLEAGIAHGGTTLRDYRSLDGSSGQHQQHLSCYGRAGQPCPRCGTALRRRVLDGRGTTWCPTCQRR